MQEWIRGITNMSAGVLIFWTAQHWLPTTSPLVLGWAGLIGVVLILHFGSFLVLSCAWRTVGVDAPPLMNVPIYATSLAEFWGKRWNIAFRDLAHRFLFRPLHATIGPAAALVVGFTASGVIHDIVISVPAGGGHGGPTAYFVIQAIAILAERSSVGRILGLGRGFRGWLFSAIVLIAPIRLLFHNDFVLRVAVPFMNALGAA
jgi:D-alanyl-lipoteichoic acid acyltransferase DltB (MBOAT superfamily)